MLRFFMLWILWIQQSADKKARTLRVISGEISLCVPALTTFPGPLALTSCVRPPSSPERLSGLAEAFTTKTDTFIHIRFK